mgnify:FL=1
MTQSLPMIMTLACLKLHMTPAETLVASTLHAARAIGIDHRLGSLELGKQADMVMWQFGNVDMIPYHFGVNWVDKVFKSGKVVFENEAVIN